MCLNTTGPQCFLPSASSVNCPFDLFRSQIKLYLSNLSGSTSDSSKRSVREIQSGKQQHTSISEVWFFNLELVIDTHFIFEHNWTAAFFTKHLLSQCRFGLLFTKQLCSWNPSNLADDSQRAVPKRFRTFGFLKFECFKIAN